MAEEQLFDTPCCEEPYNPKANLRRGSSPRLLRFSKPQSPIPSQVEDSEELKAFFTSYRDVYVPYAGTDAYTSHSLLGFLMSLKELSPTQNAVVSNMMRHSFGGKISLVRRVDPIFDIEQSDELSTREKLRYYEFLRMVEVYGSDRAPISLRRLAKINFDYRKASGNYYMELVRGFVAGQAVFRVYIHRPTHCLYLATNPGEDRWIAISPVWSNHYILKHPPDVLPLYPNWLNLDGVERTIVHVKEGDFPWYGRPDSMGSMLDQFYEFQAADYKSKATANQFMGQAFIELEDDQGMAGQNQQSQASGFDDFANELEYNFSNKSQDPQTLMVTTRPYGSSPAFVFQFSPNTNEGWYKTTQEQAENNIIKSHGWSRRLLGMDVSAGMNTNAYLDELEVLSATVIKDIQEQEGEPINNIILREAALHFGMEQMLDYSIEFQSPFAHLLEERKQANGNNDNNPRRSSAPQPGE